MALDERLSRRIDRAGEPADPSGVYEDLVRRHEHRRIARRVGAGILAMAVVAGCVVGIYALTRVLRPGGDVPAVEIMPTPILPHENGRIAYSVSTGSGMELHSMRADGSGDRTIPTPPGLPWLHAWSPDGSRIAVAIFPGGGGERGIWVMDADGSDPLQVGSFENVSVPSWSPDGGSIAYAARANGRTEIHLVDPEGTSDRIIHSEGAEGTFSIFSAQFSPDGTQILFDRGTDSGFDIFVMAADGGNVRQLTTTGTDYDPHWSPDGSQIVFTRQEIVGGIGGQSVATSNIFVMKADGSDVRRLTSGDDRSTNLYPQWSPDGTKIAYLAGITGGPGALVVMNADGSKAASLVENDVLGISWQPLPGTGTSVRPTPTPSDEDIGLGFQVCDVTSVGGLFAPGVHGTAWVATKTEDVGCPALGEGVQVVAVDVSGDGLADTSFGPLECDPWCSAFAAPDVDGDGTDELLIQNIQFSIAGLRLYDVRSDPQRGVVPVTVASPGYPGEGLAPGAEPQLWIGGDGFDSEALRCFEDQPPPTGPGRVLIQTSATQVPPDSADSIWHATETWFDLQPDGTVTIVDRGDFEEPVGSGPASFAQRDGLCGARLPTLFGG